MTDVLELMKFMQALFALRNKYLMLCGQRDLPGLTSEDRIGISLEIDNLAKKIVELVVTHLKE